MRDLRRIDHDIAKKEAMAARQSLERLRDDVRARIHLGGSELRGAFEDVEREADQLLAGARPVAARTIHQLAVRLRRLAHALEGKQ